MSFIYNLIDLIKNTPYVYIQTHNFPDHDAVASAYGLFVLLEKLNLKSYIVYEGEIQRDSLKEMIKQLQIEIKHISEYDMKKDDKIIIVDGCKGNNNVTDLIGDEIAVIDHHEVECPDNVKIFDIRPGYGACSTIINSYYEELNIEIPRNVVNALTIGIDMDTALFTRDASIDDVSAYANLYSFADIRLVNSILRNYIQIKDLYFFKEAIENLYIKNSFGYCYFSDGCNQNLLGILGDFLLALKEIDFVVLAANNNNRINFSLRSERKEWNAAIIIQEILAGIGFGGGHADMAGGIINNCTNYEELNIKEKIIKYLGI